MYMKSRKFKDNKSRSVAEAVSRTDGSGAGFLDNRMNSSLSFIQRKASERADILQRKSVPGVSGHGNFSDLGNGKFGTDKPTNASEVAGLVNAINATGTHQNVKVLTGTHGSDTGDLVGEHNFYNEDLVHEGHKSKKAGWINVLDVIGHNKGTIGGWMSPGSSAIVLAWCYSKQSDENWDNVHCYKNGADYKSGKKVW